MASRAHEGQENSHVLSDLEQENKVQIYLVNGKATVWNAEDVVMLREHFRIVGVLVGCLPRAPRQNIHLGLPLELMPEETNLLLEKGFAELVKEKAASPRSVAERVKAIDAARRANFKEQQELYHEDRRREMMKRLPLILEGKKAKRKRVLAEAGEADMSAEDDSVADEITVDSLPVTVTAEKHMLLQLFTENPWTRETENAAGDWQFPTTEAEKLRCAVFRDLWEKEYFLTSGQKFGGDFLAYPGDPSRFHSFYIVICVDFNKQLPALDIVSMGRLGSNVRKTVLLASTDYDGSVKYTSLQWTGLS
ncbi:hypothetical protein BaRGS_00021423 [Batillaria attramentaria]|uniref:tRNA-splicing endonuclease subunit Sen34 n=1 Tax=Batillaria attramentaria TaxID=370345 RepID=A0ABD0KJK1_9CAEN